MVLDFGAVKKQIKTLIDAEVDHKLLVPAQNLAAKAAVKGNMISASMATQKGEIHLYTPQQGMVLVSTPQITPASVTEYLQCLIAKILPSNVKKAELTLRPENISGAYYHYAHGLKKHQGNCQRIAHGHCSALEIYQQDQRCTWLENEWALHWQDIYLGSIEDLTNPQDLKLSAWVKTIDPQTHHCFSYTSEQGLFELAMPKNSVQLINSDTTVECLAAFIHQTLKQQHNICTTLTVYAYEGVGKGVIFSDE